MTVWIGTSGWQYDDWRGPVYPKPLAQRAWLESYSARFATVESNNAFYHLPERRVFEAWAERTPADFVMAVKVSRYLTHIKRLADPAEPVARFLDRARGLGAKLGPALIQLPPQLRCDSGRLAATLDPFPRSGSCSPSVALPCASPTVGASSGPSGGRPTGPTCGSTRAGLDRGPRMATPRSRHGPGVSGISGRPTKTSTPTSTTTIAPPLPATPPGSPARSAASASDRHACRASARCRW